MSRKSIFIIYKIHCDVTNKDYIGITNDFRRRMIEHKNCKSNTYLANSIRKYGWENFTQFVIDDAITWEEACTKEKQYINNLNSLIPNGMNMDEGGTGGIHSEETKKKIGNSNRGRKYSNEVNKSKGRCGILNAQYGKPGPKAFLGKTHSEETKRVISKKRKMQGCPWNIGKIFSEERKNNISKARKAQGSPWLKGLKRTEEANQKNRNAHLGKKHTEETILKMKEVHKKQPRDPITHRFIKKT